MKKKSIKNIGWKRSYQKSFISSIGYFDLACLGISCQNILKDFGYRFIGT